MLISLTFSFSSNIICKSLNYIAGLTWLSDHFHTCMPQKKILPYAHVESQGHCSHGKHMHISFNTSASSRSAWVLCMLHAMYALNVMSTTSTPSPLALLLGYDIFCHSFFHHVFAQLCVFVRACMRAFVWLCECAYVWVCLSVCVWERVCGCVCARSRRPQCLWLWGWHFNLILGIITECHGIFLSLPHCRRCR